MILIALILIPLVAGGLAWLLPKQHPTAVRWLALVAILLQLGLAVGIWIGHFNQLTVITEQGQWLMEVSYPWISQFGIEIALGLDGLSLLLVILTGFLGVISVLASWQEIDQRVGTFHFHLLWVLAGITGVFLALDLFLFYFFWEMMLIPMYFLIGLWGHERRFYAAIKFFIFTQASGLVMLLAIIALHVLHFQETGVATFHYENFLQLSLAPTLALPLLLGFFIAFAVKLPVFPLHTWLPDAHTEAPTAGSVILAGLLLKTAAYGLIRFAWPLFPTASAYLAPWAMVLGVIGILYGAKLAFAQSDLKRLVAYSSVSHLGFVLLGVFSRNELALQGAVMQMICHGLSTGGLFIVAGILQKRLGTREIYNMGGLWAAMPRLGGITMVLVMASLGLPGLGNFVGEFLILLGVFQVSPLLAVLASLGLVAASIYSLWIIQTVFHGSPQDSTKPLVDLSPRSLLLFGLMIVVLLWLGFYPQPVLDTARPALSVFLEGASH